MLKQLTNTASAQSIASCVISFEPLPQEYFAGDQSPARLDGFRDRVQNIASQGVDYFLLLRFDERQATQQAEHFIEQVLVKKLKAKHILVGDDFHFGHKREGDFSTLQTLSHAHGFIAQQYDTISMDDQRVSSTRIRKALNAGNLEQASILLGRNYAISGRVVHGEKVGRQLGFPTANIALKQHRPPLRGVFAVVAHDQNTNKSYAAVANLGERPTVGGRRLLLEVHVLDSDVSLYGHHLKIDFHEFIRGEKKFDSLDALKTAITDDSDTASRILNGNPKLTFLSNRIH
ncbi:UNVERIFIED_CONTAM: hypothetical protein GTU68_061225 [Idotea baltica]|nr:hypothetical protein [Idotea baltica]